MSEIEDNKAAAGAPAESPFAGIPPELVSAFFTGDQGAIARWLATNPTLVRGIVRGLPPGVLRTIADSEDVIDADEDVEIDEEDGEEVPDDDGEEERTVVGRRRASAAPASRRVPAKVQRQPVVEPEEIEEEGGYSDDVRAALQSNPIAAMNDLGMGIAGMLAELPGVQLGITFLPGGRKVMLAFYYPGADGMPEEILAQHTAHVSRFGDLIDTAYATAEHAVGMEQVDDDLDGYDEDEVDGEDAEDEEPEEPARRPARRPVRRR